VVREKGHHEPQRKGADGRLGAGAGYGMISGGLEETQCL
jgi:hypothetical protein